MKEVVVYNSEGDIIERYSNLRDLATAYGVNHATVVYWLRKDVVRDGKTFDYANPEQKTTYKPRKKKAPSEAEEQDGCEEEKEEPLDRVNNTIIPYETIGTRLCTTPCPFKLSPKVGSYLCQTCASFRGISRKTHEVACAHSMTSRNN